MLNKIHYKVIKSQVISRIHVSVTGLLTGTPTQRSVTGLILQPLRSLSMFAQTAKLVASTRNADKLKMFAWDNEDVQVLHCQLVAASWTRPGQAPRRQGAESLILARGAICESQLCALARLGQTCSLLQGGTVKELKGTKKCLGSYYLQWSSSRSVDQTADIFGWQLHFTVRPQCSHLAVPQTLLICKYFQAANSIDIQNHLVKGCLAFTYITVRDVQPSRTSQTKSRPSWSLPTALHWLCVPSRGKRGEGSVAAVYLQRCTGYACQAGERGGGKCSCSY